MTRLAAGMLATLLLAGPLAACSGPNSGEDRRHDDARSYANAIMAAMDRARAARNGGEGYPEP